MKLRGFKKIIKSLMNKKTGLLNKDKIKEIPDEVKDDMCKFIVRYRQPVVKDLIPERFDFGWLASMGYMYHYNNGEFDFVGLSEHYQKFLNKLN
jgi:hypothetical protein